MRIARSNKVIDPLILPGVNSIPHYFGKLIIVNFSSPQAFFFSLIITIPFFPLFINGRVYAKIAHIINMQIILEINFEMLSV